MALATSSGTDAAEEAPTAKVLAQIAYIVGLGDGAIAIGVGAEISGVPTVSRHTV